jgi:putative ABC transport system permease protein
MLENYFKTAWRNIVKNKAHGFINISGLSIGMAVAILIGLWIWDELSFDKYNKNYNTIAQIARKEITNGETYVSSGSNHFPIPLAYELRKNYQNLFKQVSIATEVSKHILDFNGNKFAQQGMYAEQDFANIFTLNMIKGSSAGFSDPNSILLSESAAKALFGKADVIGQIVKLDNVQPLKVSGVFENLPRNTTFSEVNFLCPWSLLVSTNKDVKDKLDDWDNSSFYIFTQAQPGISVEKISAVIKTIYWAKIKDMQGKTAGNKVDLFLHPMKDWHLRSEWKNGVQAGGQIQIVWLFGIIGVFVLLLACINFMNLSTARSENRAKEVGIRKAIGSLRSQLINQFLGESLLYVLLAFMLSIILSSASLNWFNQIADKKIVFPFSNVPFWFFSLAFIIVTACLAGSYPALYLSSFNPVKVLKGTFKTGRLTIIPRKVLLTVQFTVSIILIIGTIVVHRQIQLAQNRSIGYDRKGLIHITMNTPDLNGKYDVLQKELLSSGGAVSFAQSSSANTEDNYFDDRFEWEGKNPNLSAQSFALMAVTYDYGKTVGWQIEEGRDFSRNFSTDNKAVILNEAAVKYMQLRHPIGKQIKWHGNLFTVTGVIKDIVKGSPFTGVQQSLFFMVPDVGPNIVIRLNPQLSAAEAISKIEPVFRKLNPSSPFEYTFVDDDYARKFATEQRVGTLSTIFATLALFISCLGIFGLASFVAEQRVKEIGVRKILGASVFGLWRLMSKDFVTLVFISFLLATPLAYYFMHNWLQNYQYKAELSWWIFAAAGIGALIITLMTVSFQSIKAAIANPVKSLRTE